MIAQWSPFGGILKCWEFFLKILNADYAILVIQGVPLALKGLTGLAMYLNDAIKKEKFFFLKKFI